MNNAPNSATATFLQHFFGDYNQIKHDQVEGGVGAIVPWVRRLNGKHPLPTVLPNKVNDHRGTQYLWYAVAKSERELRDLSEDLTAFIGPTWSTFRGERALLNPSDPTDSAVLAYSDGLAFKFSGNNKKIWDSLERMRRVWEKRKSRAYEDLRPPGRVLRDFYMALQASNRASAEQELNYLKSKHGYDALNILFLRVQMLAALERWEELLNSLDLSDLLQARRPLAVTQALITAVYTRELALFEVAAEVGKAESHFRQEIIPRYGSLFTVRSGMHSPEVIKSFMLLAASSEPPKPALRDELLSLPYIEDKDRDYIHRLAALIPSELPARVEEPLQQAMQLLFNGEYDQAFQIAVGVPSSAQRVRILIASSIELQTIESENSTLEAFYELSSGDQTQVLASRSNYSFIERVSGTSEVAESNLEVDARQPVEYIPDDWTSWLTRLYSEPEWGRALEIARRGAMEWDVKDILKDQNELRKLVELLNAYPPVAETTIHNSLPFLLDFFRKDEDYPRQECLEAYNVLLDVLAVSTKGGDDDLTLFNELVQAQLSLGVDAIKYTEMLSHAEYLWGQYASPSKIDWILDLVDSLILYSSPAQEERIKLLSFVVNKFPQFARRVEPAQWQFLTLLIRDLHQEESLLSIVKEYEATSEPTERLTFDVLTRLAGKSVSIYTLTKPVAQRVKGIVQAICASVTVHLCHDKVGSDRLRQLARNSDIFIMATASAKHAATGFIEANRGDLPLLRPSGKGSASMLRALRIHLEASADFE